MKKTVRNLSIAFMLFLCFQCSLSDVFGQAPQSISYQAVIRNASDILVTNYTIGMQVSILQGSSTGTAVYVETHTPTTNANGLATIAIGNGTVVSGTFATIDWSAGPYYIKTETDPNGGINYTITGTQQFLSVPFALYSAASGSSVPGPTGLTGAAGADGAPGLNGTNGVDGATGPMGPTGVLATNCLQCHKHDGGSSDPDLVAEKKKEYELSAHAEDWETAVGEGYTVGCAPCHAREGFLDVVSTGVVPTMTLTSGKYSFSYNATAANSSGLTHMPNTIDCWACHKSSASDSMALSTTAAIPMTMYPVYPVGDPHAASAKTLNITQKNGESNLCAKCHQPRPAQVGTATSVTLANGTSVTIPVSVANGANIDYADLAANPTALFYDSIVAHANTNKLFLSYRFGNHYGAVGGIISGQSGVQFTGSMLYTDISTHATSATCQDCHMATPTGLTGGHTFRQSNYDDAGAATFNFNGCKTTGCHSSMSTTSTMWTGTRNNTTSLLNQIAAKLVSGGVGIMHKNTDVTGNPWYYVTAAHYDGYVDIYDPSTNPSGAIQNPVASSSWTPVQKATNLALPRLISLTNVQMGAIINFQLSIREFSLGVHNPKYSTALLQNTLEALTAAGF